MPVSPSHPKTGKRRSNTRNQRRFNSAQLIHTERRKADRSSKYVEIHVIKKIYVDFGNFWVFERLLPVLGATARRAQCPERRFQETASADSKMFSQTSTAIELKLRIKRVWPQELAKRRKRGSDTDRSWRSWQVLLVGRQIRGSLY